jgi:hypothetical protein
VSMVAGDSISMPLFVALRLFLVGDGFSPAWFFHPCCGDGEMSSGLSAAAQSSLTCLEELLWKSGPIISFLFPTYVPLVSALIFACSNLAPRILSLLAPSSPIRLGRPKRKDLTCASDRLGSCSAYSLRSMPSSLLGTAIAIALPFALTVRGLLTVAATGAARLPGTTSSVSIRVRLSGDPAELSRIRYRSHQSARMRGR